MANVARWPTLTSPEVEKDSTRTQSCGVLWVLCGGGDLVELGEGVGLGDLLDVLGDGEGDVELDELSVGGDDVPDGEFPPESEALGVDDGLALEVLLGEGEADLEVLGDADFEEAGEADLLLVLLTEPLGDADALLRLDLLADAEADADSLALWLRGWMIAADSTAFFGGDEHVE
jgi:hypothetical protein